MPTAGDNTVQVLEIEYDKIDGQFPPNKVTELFWLITRDFEGERGGVRTSDTSEPSLRLVQPDEVRVYAHYTSRDEIDEYISRVLRGKVLSAA